MAEYSISQINSFLLRKQHLTENTKIQSVAQVTKDIWGLHATNAGTPYLSLFTRMNNFSKDSLDREIIEKRLVKIRCVRKTVHIIPKENVSIAFSATKEAIQINSEKYYKFMGVSESEYRNTSEAILSLLGNKGMNASEIKKELNLEINLSPIINYMCDVGILVRGLSKAGWKSNAHTYYRMDKYLPEVNINQYSQEEARKKLVRQYLSSFGPVTLTDIAWWAGFPKTEVKSIVDSLEDIDYVNISGLGEYLISSNDKDLLKNVKENNKPEINLLPNLDPYIMGYKERERYLDKEHYNYIFDRSGNATTTFINNGKIIGVWDFEEKPSPTVKVFLFERHIIKEIEKKAKEIGKFISSQEPSFKICKDMAPLDKRTVGSFMAPLKDMDG
ncbi:MAG: hypothetical protein APG12_00010 [Candidatus Methanofastidiosum methylothiophilum]|uniref:Winged helix DNA-binding domain-containing protein n=1 Tax=Candidatus Methanofastidiosum methylothiophilum TaxID=1705564 RepID=A0A150IIJ6_9EURY|nr:MAG: hypothetical protein APG10_01399 [Candidatus Methanofastidiosum methylthiophilus]KYC48701.1 MAG: hypothetical protein APG11_00011 [Candidatus Methanofastidiosum methylthiophilus]KYC51349.1 MAG: hypothetical protein APG12_00010 [Candidatus Methanofastidiosum methylthiophilus]